MAMIEIEKEASKLQLALNILSHKQNDVVSEFLADFAERVAKEQREICAYELPCNCGDHLLQTAFHLDNCIFANYNGVVGNAPLIEVKEREEDA